MPQPSLLAFGSALGGLLVLLFSGLWLVVAMESDAESISYALAGGLLVAGVADSVCGVLAIRHVRAAGGWLTGLPAALFGTLVFPLMAANGLVLIGLLVTDEAGVYVLAGAAVLAANAYGVAHAWRWASADYSAAPRGHGNP